MKKREAKLAESVKARLEEGEQVRLAFLAQTPFSPYIYLLVAPFVLMFMVKFKTVVATDRNVYVFQNVWMRTYKQTEDEPYKRPLAEANVEGTGTYARIDGGPKLWVALVEKSKPGELKALADAARGDAGGATSERAQPAAS